MDKYDMMIVEQIKVMLEEKGLEYEDDGEGIVTSGFKRYNFLYHVREDSLDFRVLIKKEVPEECMDEMLKLLNYANGITKDGHWELMGNHVYYRTYTFLPILPLNASLPASERHLYRKEYPRKPFLFLYRIRQSRHYT